MKVVEIKFPHRASFSNYHTMKNAFYRRLVISSKSYLKDVSQHNKTI